MYLSLFEDLRLPTGLPTLQELEFKTSDQSEEAESLRSELKHVQQELEGTKLQSITLRRDLEKAEGDKLIAEQRMNECIRRMEEAEHKRKVAERDSKRAIEAAEKSRAEATAEELEKLETQKLAAERMTQVARTQRRCELLEQERDELIQVPVISELSSLNLLSPSMIPFLPLQECIVYAIQCSHCAYDQSLLDHMHRLFSEYSILYWIGTFSES